MTESSRLSHEEASLASGSSGRGWGWRGSLRQGAPITAPGRDCCLVQWDTEQLHPNQPDLTVLH